MPVNRHHAEHPGEPLTLTAAQVCELDGCAGEEAVRAARRDSGASPEDTCAPQPGDSCPQCGLADLEPRGAKHVCPSCGFIAPCCQP